MSSTVEQRLENLAQKVCSLLGLILQDCTFLRHTSTFAVARLDVGEDVFALRLEAPRTGKQASIEKDVAIRRKLATLDGRIAAPIASSADFPDIHWPGSWVLDQFIDGVDGDTVDAALVPWAEIGEVLAVVHGLEGSDVSESVTDGVEARFQDAWPVCGKDLPDHPIALQAPELVTAFLPLRTQIAEAARNPPVVLQGDPGIYNMRLKQGSSVKMHLSGLLDFNDAFMGPAAWDFGFISHYFGPDVLRKTLEGYGAHAPSLYRDARLLGLAAGLHRASRSASLNNKDRERRVLARLRFDAGEMGLL